jgi:hypothetical protein
VKLGLIGDFDSMPDLDDLGDLMKESTAELLAAARSSSAPAAEEPAPSA